MQNVVRIADPRLETFQEHRSFHSGCAAVDMRLVQNEESQLCPRKDQIVFWPQHHIFKHCVIRDQDMRRGRAHLIARDDFVFQRRHRLSSRVFKYFSVLDSPLLFFFFRAAVVDAERNFWIVSE